MNRCKIYDDGMICKTCNKSFSTKYNRKIHESKCCKQHNNEMIISKLNELDTIVKNRDFGSTTIIQNNNHIHLTCNFGSEDMSYITINDIISLFDKGENFLDDIDNYDTIEPIMDRNKCLLYNNKEMITSDQFE